MYLIALILCNNVGLSKTQCSISNVRWNVFSTTEYLSLWGGYLMNGPCFGKCFFYCSPSGREITKWFWNPVYFFFFSFQPKWQGRFSDHQLNEQISCLNIFPLSLHKWNKFPKGKYCFFGHKSSLSFFQEQLYENTAKFQDDSFVYTDGGGDIFSRKKLNLPSPIPSKGQALPFGNWLPWQSSISWIRWCITVTYTMSFKGVGFQTVQGSFPCHLGCLCALRWGNTVGFQKKAAVHSCFVDQDML